MPVERVKDVTLTKIPDLDSRVAGCRKKVSSVGVESDLVDAVGGGIVVLNWLLTADIEDFDHFISTSTCDASTIRMEFDRLYTSVMIVESSDKSLRGNIPQFAGAVLGSRGDESSIRGEHS